MNLMWIRNIYHLFKPRTNIQSELDSSSHIRLKKIVLASSSAVLHKGVTLGTTLISIPLTLNYLGEERFAIWMIVSSILSVMTFSDMGLGNALVNVISSSGSSSNSKDNNINSYISTTFFMLLITSVVAGLTYLAVEDCISWGRIFNVSGDLAKEESRQVGSLVILIFLISLPLSLVQKVQTGLQNIHVNNIWLTVASVLSLLGVLISVSMEVGLPWLLFSILIGPVFANVCNGVKLFFLDRKDLCPDPRNFNVRELIEVAKIGILFFLLQLSSLVANSLDNIVIAQVLGAQQVTVYAITKKIFVLVQLGQYMISPFWPVFNEAMANSDYLWAKSTLTKIIFMSITLGLVSTLPVLLFGDWIISTWINPDLNPSLFLFLGFFLWTILVNYGGCMSVFMSGDKFIKSLLFFVAAASAASLVFQVIFCSLYGINGVIYGVLVGHLLFFVYPVHRTVFGSLNRLINQQ
jgi:O-antigen/teichoic acid export membrane protein